MPTEVSDSTSRTDRDDRTFPAYGSVEAVLAYALFYVLVDRMTPAIVETFSETVLNLSPSFVRFGLATALWFILVVTVIDQIRRQLAALGVVPSHEYQIRVWSRVTPPSVRTAGYLSALVVGGVVAAITFDRAVESLLWLIQLVASVNITEFEVMIGTEFDVVSLAAMIAFFVTYGVATHSLDRLVVDGIRSLASD